MISKPFLVYRECGIIQQQMHEARVVGGGNGSTLLLGMEYCIWLQYHAQWKLQQAEKNKD